MAKSQSRVTSADVARASGVSRATVSYVLNNDPKQTIPAETRQRVLDEAKRLGYSPFAPARVLRAGYSRLVLAVVQYEMIDPGMARNLKALEESLAAHGFSLITYVGIHNTKELPQLSANLTPAVVLAYANQTDPIVASFLHQFNVPIIYMLNSGYRQPVGQIQVAYLVKKGYSRIIYAAPGRRDIQWLSELRLEGVRRQCAELGLEPPLVQTIPDVTSEVSGMIAQLLSKPPTLTGICCYNDEIAFAVLASLRELEIEVPKAVAVIGCDDIALAQFSAPPLTTVTTQASDIDKLRELSLENILAALRGEPLKPVPSLQLVVKVRESA